MVLGDEGFYETIWLKSFLSQLFSIKTLPKQVEELQAVCG